MQATLLRVGRMHCGLGKVGVGRRANRSIGRFGVSLATSSSHVVHPPHPMTYVDAVLSTMGGSTCRNSLALAPLALTLPTVDGQLRMVCQCAWPCCCTGCRHRPCAPSPPERSYPPTLTQCWGGFLPQLRPLPCWREQPHFVAK